MLIAILFGALVNTAIQGTTQFESCQESNFEHESCWNSRQMKNLGSAVCSIQGKELEGRSCKAGAK